MRKVKKIEYNIYYSPPDGVDDIDPLFLKYNIIDIMNALREAGCTNVAVTGQHNLDGTWSD